MKRIGSIMVGLVLIASITYAGEKEDHIAKANDYYEKLKKTAYFHDTYGETYAILANHALLRTIIAQNKEIIQLLKDRNKKDAKDD